MARLWPVLKALPEIRDSKGRRKFRPNRGKRWTGTDGEKKSDKQSINKCHHEPLRNTLPLVLY